MWLKFPVGPGSVGDLRMFACLASADLALSPATALESQGTEGIASFTVAVPTKNFDTLGLLLELTETSAPTVLGMEEGAIQEFNKVYTASGIRPFDVLLALNGTQNWETMQKKMTSKLPDKMFLTFNRPRKIQVVVEETHDIGDMGMTLAYTDKSVGVVIQELNDSGRMAKWNTKRKSHGHDAIEVMDRIIEFDGKAYCGTDLAKLLEEKKIWRLTVLKYAQGEIPVLEGLSRGGFCWVVRHLAIWRAFLFLHSPS